MRVCSIRVFAVAESLFILLLHLSATRCSFTWTAAAEGLEQQQLREQQQQEEEAAVAAAASWVVHYPHDFHNRSSKTGELLDNRGNGPVMRSFRTLVAARLQTVDGYTDGEVVDALEHFFWGQTDGVAVELGALDGSLETHSMTFDLESSCGWKRILVDGNPQYRAGMKQKSPHSFSVNAAICEKQGQVTVLRSVFFSAYRQRMYTVYVIAV